MAYVKQEITQKPEVQQGAEDSLRYFAANDGELQDVEVAYVTILDPNGGIVVERQEVTDYIELNGFFFKQTWETDPYALAEDYAVVWEWTVDGIPYADRQSFDVVFTKLPCLVDVDHIRDVYPNILNHIKALKTDEGEEETDLVARFIRAAWSRLLDSIKAAGNRPSLILDRTRLMNPAIQLACNSICNALVREQDDVWERRAATHTKNFDALWAGLGTLKYDVVEDGIAGTGETTRVNKIRSYV